MSKLNDWSSQKLRWLNNGHQANHLMLARHDLNQLLDFSQTPSFRPIARVSLIERHQGTICCKD